MKVITGAAGFIGSCMLSKLNQEGVEDIIIVDDFSRKDREPNWKGKSFVKRIDREDFIDWFKDNAERIDSVYHLGARSHTTEFDWNVLLKLNVDYSKEIWKICSKNDIPLVYASSAATYGDGNQGYDDDLSKIKALQPLNPYGKSKQVFDLWQLSQEKQPPFWAGLKFFNVYGPNEYHKQRMASVVLHSFEQINIKGKVGLFKSYKEGIKDGEQKRDFVYVKDLVDVMYFLMKHKTKSDIYNVGTGIARSFYDLARLTFSAMDRVPEIEFIPMPEDIRSKYQYFTQANINKLRSIGYSKEMHSLEEGVNDYVRNYLIQKSYY
ncbi:MAG: ADP-glyceromanno-heptose 6-epimerase [Bacteroidales bacterium]|nr:ADP-glyceromanno-heptose 6-epimerase [Bacteroidales bacterium]